MPETKHCECGVAFHIEGDETEAVNTTWCQVIDIVDLLSHECHACGLTKKKHCRLLMAAINTERAHDR